MSTALTSNQLRITRYSSIGEFVSTEIRTYVSEQERNEAYFTEYGLTDDESGDYLVSSLQADWSVGTLV